MSGHSPIASQGLACTGDGAPLFPLMFGVSGPLGLPLTSQQDVARLVATALEGGINAFDTGPSYGRGEAERRLGAALQGVARGGVYISSKVGTKMAGLRRLVKDFSAGGMRRSLEESLTRLGTDHLDALILHGPAPDVLTAELFDTLAHWRKEGLFRHLGAAVRGRDAINALRHPDLVWVMAPACCDMPDDEFAALARRRADGHRVIAIETLRPSQARWRTPTRASDLFHIARAVVAPPRPSPSRKQSQDPEQALTWALQEAPCDLVAVTTTRRAHLIANMALARRHRGL